MRTRERLGLPGFTPMKLDNWVRSNFKLSLISVEPADVQYFWRDIQLSGELSEGFTYYGRIGNAKRGQGCV